MPQDPVPSSGSREAWAVPLEQERDPGDTVTCVQRCGWRQKPLVSCGVEGRISLVNGNLTDGGMGEAVCNLPLRLPDKVVTPVLQMREN